MSRPRTTWEGAGVGAFGEPHQGGGGRGGVPPKVGTATREPSQDRPPGKAGGWRCGRLWRSVRSATGPPKIRRSWSSLALDQPWRSVAGVGVLAGSSPGPTPGSDRSVVHHRRDLDSPSCVLGKHHDASTLAYRSRHPHLGQDRPLPNPDRPRLKTPSVVETPFFRMPSDLVKHQLTRQIPGRRAEGGLYDVGNRDRGPHR